MNTDQNIKNYEDIYKKYRLKREKILGMGGEKSIKKQHDSGKLTARERLKYFFDDGVYTETGLYVEHRTTAFGLNKKEIPAEALIVGFGKVNDRYVMAAAEDFTSLAGTFGEYHGKKFAEAVKRAKDMGIPFVGLNDSGGARLQEGFDTMQSYTWLFEEQILASGIIPQIGVIMGPCLGGQAYHPIMQDFVVQCKKTGFMGIAGPPFVKAQLGIDISIEKLCGANTQASESGGTHIVADDDRDALDKVKRLLSFLPSNNREKSFRTKTGDDPERTDENLNTMVPAEPFKYFDIKELILKIVDNRDFFEIHKKFAKNVIVGFARMDGATVGIVANQSKWKAGVLDCNAADKVARFVRFCDLFNIPLVNFHDAPGFLIGPKEERKGILRHGAKMLYAYIEATVPKISIIVRKSYAGAYAGMCSKGTGADFMYAWPNARVSIVGGATAASVIFAKDIKNADDPEKMQTKLIDQYEKEFVNPYEGAKRGYIDDVIMPEDTRKIIIRSLEMLANKTVARPFKKYSNINL